jgi:hypothetical protein
MECDTIHSRILSKLYQDWQTWCGAGALPKRADFDPVEHGYALGHIALVEVHGEPGDRRFRFRVNGQHQVDWQRFDLTGRWLDEHPEPQMRAQTQESYETVVETRTPLFFNRDVVLDGRAWRYEALVLPLSCDGESVNLLLVGIHHTG